MAVELGIVNILAINEICCLAVKLKNYAVQSQMPWFVDEQVEQEKLMAEMLAMPDIAEDNPGAMLVLNSQMVHRGGGGIGLTLADGRFSLEWPVRANHCPV